MKVKIVYYSLEGNTKFIVDSIKETLSADVVELIPKKSYIDKGFKKYFFGGKSVFLKETPELEAYDNKVDYDLIIIATPIWAGTFSPPIRTFLANNSLKGKKIALIACHAGGDYSKYAKEVQKICPECNIVSVIDFLDPLKKNTGEQKEKALQWAESL